MTEGSLAPGLPAPPHYLSSSRARLYCTMLAGFPAVLLLLGLAHASPVSLVSTAVPHVLKHPSSTARWDCDVKAYVRAPDLSPNVLLQGDARLVANGTACTDLVGWQLGLVMKERAIVRLVAEGATLPSQPKYNELEAEAWDEHREDPWNDVYPVTWRLLGDQRQSPWDVAMEAYQSAMANVSLWQVHGAERAIFDLKVDLASATGEHHGAPGNSRSMSAPMISLFARTRFDSIRVGQEFRHRGTQCEPSTDSWRHYLPDRWRGPQRLC